MPGPMVVPADKTWAEARRKFIAKRHDLMLPKMALADMAYVGLPNGLRQHVRMQITATLDLSAVHAITINRVAGALKTGILPVMYGKAADILRVVASAEQLPVVKLRNSGSGIYCNFHHEEFKQAIHAAALLNRDAFRNSNPHSPGYTPAWSNWHEYEQGQMYGWNMYLPRCVYEQQFAEYVADDEWRATAERLRQAVLDRSSFTVTGDYHDATASYDFRSFG